MREKQPRLLVLWGKYDWSIEPSEPEVYRREWRRLKVTFLRPVISRLDTGTHEIVALVRAFVGSAR